MSNTLAYLVTKQKSFLKVAKQKMKGFIKALNKMKKYLKNNL